MRISEVFALREHVRNQTEPLPDVRWPADRAAGFRVENKVPIRRRVLDSMAPRILRWKQAAFESQVKAKLSQSYDLLCVGERFMRGAIDANISSRMKNVENVLVQGCGFGDSDVQRWLRRGVKSVAGIELMNYEACWEHTIPKLEATFGAKVEFKQASVDDIPYSDASFGATSSAAVYEHVYRLKEAAQESARILRSGGFCAHSIGPLYFCYAGDHCIDAYGADAGYDHLLLDDAEYRRRVSDRNVFDKQPDPMCNFWATCDRFSFARLHEYFEAFQDHFNISFLLMGICEQSLRFRDRFPEKWNRMLDAGLNEEDLMVKAVHAVWEKK